jgi:hypothetical protein
MSEFGDNASLVGAEEDISHEQLQMIKARTMFQMTEEIADDATGGRKRLLFLTNSQADFLASSGASLQKMLDALEIPKPKLIINLLSSQGFTDYCTSGSIEEAGLVPGYLSTALNGAKTFLSQYCQSQGLYRTSTRIPTRLLCGGAFVELRGHGDSATARSSSLCGRSSIMRCLSLDAISTQTQ